jgi:hypothetical protein
LRFSLSVPRSVRIGILCGALSGDGDNVGVWEAVLHVPDGIEHTYAVAVDATQRPLSRRRWLDHLWASVTDGVRGFARLRRRGQREGTCSLVNGDKYKLRVQVLVPDPHLMAAAGGDLLQELQARSLLDEGPLAPREL